MALDPALESFSTTQDALEVKVLENMLLLRWGGRKELCRAQWIPFLVNA